MRADASAATVRPVIIAGVIFGIGLGGFVDGIVFHQVLQWHHMLTAYDHRRYSMTTLEGLRVNTLWDGMFHVSTWVATAAGFAALWWAAGVPNVRWSPRLLLGSLAMGWGSFNLVEGIIDHQILGMHHVRDDLGGPLSWDLGYLAFGLVLVVVGWLLIRQGSSDGGARTASAPKEGANRQRLSSPPGV